MFIGIILCGAYIAVAVSYPIFGYVAYYCEWQMVFYITGNISISYYIASDIRPVHTRTGTSGQLVFLKQYFL